MKFAVLASPNSWYARDLARAARPKHTLEIAAFSELRSTFMGGRWQISSGQIELSSYEAVFARTMPPGTLEQVVFRMDALAHLEAMGIVVLNPPKAIECAVDKYLTLARLHAAGFCVPRTVVCHTAEEAQAAFVELGQDIVLKPIFGAEGRGLARLTDADLAFRAFRMLQQMGAVLYVQEFLPHNQADVRLLVIGDEVLAMRRHNPTDWRTNASRGATCEALLPPERWVDLAKRAAKTIGAPLAGVDLLPTKDGREILLEVNAVPGWQALSRACGVDVAAKVISLAETLLHSK